MNGLKHLLWKRCKTVFIVASIELLIIALSASAVSANVYLGGYFAPSPSTTLDVKYVIMNSAAYSIPPGKIQSGNYIESTLTAAGAKNGNLSGWAYQVGNGINSDGKTFWITESYHTLLGRRDKYIKDMSTGWVTWGAIFTRLDMTTSGCWARCWGYRYNVLEFQDLYDDLVTNTGETHFRVGTTTYQNTLFKHLQFGVESYYPVTSYPWEFYEGRVGYYDGSNWKYMPAKTVYGPNTWVTYMGDWGLLIGPDKYDGVNKSWQSTNAVKWKYTGTTIGEHVSLWTTSGNILTSPSAPFQI